MLDRLFAPATGLRAWLPKYGRGETVTIDRYDPTTKLLGGPGFTLPVTAGKPLYGATLDELQAGWGAALCKFDEEAPKLKQALAANAQDSIASLRNVNRSITVCHELPRTTERSAGPTSTIRIGLDGKARAFVLALPTAGSPELTAQLVAELDAKFGKADEHQAKDYTERVYLDPAAKLQAFVTVHAQSIHVEVGPYLPLAELISGPAPGLGIATPSMPGGSFAKIQAENPAHFRQSGVLASLIYPPTEFNKNETEVELEQYAGAQQTYGYRVVLDHTDREPLGDRVFAMLEEKLGTGKPVKRDGEGQHWTFAKNGRKIAAWRVSQQWQLDVTK
ncbi:MAG: hypothetical protein M3680_33835 [Myxococcota bacterium]|nr:hypothetical protein [Myxococcota bacterium]